VAEVGCAGAYVYPAGTAARPHAPVSVNGIVFSYDANGNLLADGSRTLTYDRANRVASVAGNGTTVTLTYGPDGARARKNTPQGVTLYPDANVEYDVAGGLFTPWLLECAKRIHSSEVDMKEQYLNEKQKKVLAYVYNALGLTGDVDYFESKFDVSGKNFVVIHGVLTIDSLGAMNLLFNLPLDTNFVFLAIAEDNFSEAARILANVEDYQRSTGREIKFGETMGLDGTFPSALSQEASALIFLPCGVSLDLKPLTDDLLLDDEKLRFFLVVPITDEEIRIRHEQGFDALFSRWDEVGKNIMV